MNSVLNSLNAAICVIYVYVYTYVCMCVCVFIQGSMGTRVRAQQALFSNAGETCSNRVWSPLESAGCSSCGQTGTVKFQVDMQLAHNFP